MKNEPIWQIKFYGVRGSTPVCEAGFQKFGGNTTCIYADLLTNDRKKTIAIFDAGTGIRKLGKEICSGVIPETEDIYLLFTHFHWDHIQGLPFFDPAYIPNKKLKIFSPHQKMKRKELQRIFEVQMQQEYFPVQLDKMGAKFQFITEKKYKLTSESYVSFDYRLHNHPGGAYSYRFSAQGKTVVICTDLEHGKTIDQEVVRFCKGADLLIHDAQYTDEELETHRGWGHSSYSQAIEVAQQAGVKQLIFTHHDPDHDDDFLEKVEAECRKISPNCSMALEGMEIFV